MTADRAQSVLILGAGPAGLTAAYRLVQQGLRVTLLDQASALGGALLSSPDPPISVLGCHHAIWKLFRSLGSISNEQSLADTALEFQLSDGRLARYPRSCFPTPLHVAFTIGRFAGLSWRERWALLSWLEQIWEGSLQLPTDLEHRTAQDWLMSLGQSQPLQRSIWNPLAQWLTGNDVSRLSADALVAALSPIFLRRASDSRVAVPRPSWQSVFVQPITAALTKAGATFVPNMQAVQFQFEQERVTGIRIRDGSVVQADRYIVALPHQQLAALLPERWLSRYAYFQQIGELKSIPCTMVSFSTQQPSQPSRLILLSEGPFQWILTRPSDDGTRISLIAAQNSELRHDVERQVSSRLQSLGLIAAGISVISLEQKELPDAFLSLSPGAKAQRPVQNSPIDNLLLAGAWTDTGWPANLESAIVSGERCAEIVIGQRLG